MTRQLLLWFGLWMVLACFFFEGCKRGSIEGAQVVAKEEPVPTDSSSAGGLELSIPVPVTAGQNQREIFLNPRQRFHVLLTNISSKPINVWEDSNSWGYFALSFEVTDQSGVTYHLKKSPAVIWTGNGPIYWHIEPHESTVFDIDFTDTKTWQGIDWSADRLLYCKIRAVYEVAPSKESKEESVWTGRLVSKAEKFMVFR